VQVVVGRGGGGVARHGEGQQQQLKREAMAGMLGSAWRTTAAATRPRGAGVPPTCAALTTRKPQASMVRQEGGSLWQECVQGKKNIPPLGGAPFMPRPCLSWNQ